MICRTLAEARAAGTAAGQAIGPLTQDQADLVATILAPHVAAAVQVRAAS